MNTDRHEQYEEQVQFLDSAEALQDYLHQQVRHALAHVFEQELRAHCAADAMSGASKWRITAREVRLPT